MDQPEPGFSKLEGFEWDTGNQKKNWLKHRVEDQECEEVFFNKPLLIIEDIQHSQSEARYFAFGITDRGRKLAIAFTMRGNEVRVISARAQSKKERATYEKNSI